MDSVHLIIYLYGGSWNEDDFQKLGRDSARAASLLFYE